MFKPTLEATTELSIQMSKQLQCEVQTLASITIPVSRMYAVLPP